MNRAWLAPIAFLYGLVISIRNKLFDWGILRSEEYDIPIVCVGNLTVGGTGKTPVTELLVDNMQHQWKLAVLSRGYKRRTKGYLEVSAKDSFLKVGDEPKQIKRKFPNIVVSVCEKRSEGIRRIREEHPDVNLIILDDGFQHRRVEPWINIVLMDYNRPVYKDHLLPWGNLRDTPSQLHRAHYVIVTKCPPDMNPLDRRLVTKSLGLYPYQSLYFSTMDKLPPVALFREGEKTKIKNGMDVVAMSGIGNPGSFRDSLSESFNVVGTLEYGDHHPYRSRDLKDMITAIEKSPEGTVIITTEKDAVKLAGSSKIPEIIRERLFYIPIKIKFNENSDKEFLNKLSNDVRTNPKHSFLHPQQG